MPDVRATLVNSNPKEISEEVWAEICFELFNIVLANSPVDTGEYLANWQLNRLADDIWELYNPLEYASFLEDGWSGQAPNGVVGPAIDELPEILRDYLGRKPKGDVYVTLEVPDYEPKAKS